MLILVFGVLLLIEVTIPILTVLVRVLLPIEAPIPILINTTG